MRDLVLWAGPVYNQQVPGATVPDAVEKFFLCRGDLSPRCSEVSWSLKDAEGRRLPIAAVRAGTTLEDTRDVFLGAFSAGGGTLRDISSSPLDRPRIRALMLADGTYSGAWFNGIDGRIPLVNDFWYQWGEYIANGDQTQMWVATASTSPNGTMANGVEVLQTIRKEIEKRTGKTFTKLEHFWGITPAPDAAYQLGSIIFAEYDMDRAPHGDHATVLAPQVWKNIMHPWLARVRAGEKPWPDGVSTGLPEQEPTPEDSYRVLPWIVMASASALGYFIVRWLDRRRRGR